MSARTLLVVLAGVALAGVLLIWMRGGEERALARPPAAETPKGRSAPAPDPITLEADPAPDAPLEVARAAPEQAPRFDLDDPRSLPVVLTLPEGTPRGERPTLVLSAWKDDEDGGPAARWFGEWTEVDRLQEAGPGPDLVLRVPRDAQAVRVAVEAEYLYLAERIELEELDDLEPLRLELELGGRLRFRLVPPAATALDPAELVGAEAHLHYMRADVGFRTGPPTFLAGLLDGDLAVEFGGLRPDYSYTLRGGAGPYVPYDSEPIRVAAGETVEFEVPLEDGLELHGRVLGPDGAPLPGGSVWVSFDHGSGSSFDVDEEGEFHLRGVWPSMTAISASREGLLEASVPRDQLPTGRVIEGVVLQLSEGAAVAGTVVLPDGRPVSGASVQLREGGERFPAHRTNSDDAGRFRIAGLEEGEYVAVAEASFDRAPAQDVQVVPAGRRGFRSGGWQAEAPVRAGDEELELRLVAPVELVGRAEDDQGAPIRQIRLAAVPDRGGAIDRSALFFADHETSLETQDGEFRWGELPPGKWVVSATASGYSQPAPVRVEVPSDDRPLFVFQTRMRLTGRVLDPAGAPVPGAALEGVEVRGGVHHLGAVNAKADGEGSFGIDVDASTYLVFASADGFAPSEQLELTIERGQPVDPVVLTLRLPGRLECELQDRAGRPVPGQHVQVEGIVSADWPSHETDAAGRLVLEDLPPGTYHLSTWIEVEGDVNAPLRAVAEIQAGETTRLVLGGPLEVVLTVRGLVTSGGEPVPGCQVNLYPRDRSASPACTRTDERGRFEAALEVGGPTTATVGSPYRPIHRELVDLPASGEHELTLALPTAGLRGRVISADGDLPWGLEVHLLHAGGPSAFGGRSQIAVDLEKSGAFEALYLEPGSYVLVAAPDRRRLGFGDGDPVGGASRLVTLAAGEMIEGLELHLPEPGVLEVDVVDEQGAPVAGATIHVFDAAGRPLTAQPVPCEGAHASLSSLPLGEVLLVAVTEERVSPQPVRASVVAGEVTELELPTVVGAALVLRLAEDVDPRKLELSVRDGSGWELGRGLAYLPPDPTRRERSLRPLPPGPWTVTLTAPGGASTTQQVELAPGETRTLDLEAPD